MAFHPSDFVHPLDRTARQNLESIPLLRGAVEKFLKNYNERVVRNWQMSEMLRLGPRQFPRIYKLLPPICEAFGIDEPELYLANGPANAFTFGHTRPTITLYSGVIESMQPDEIQAVLAHECGHIVCEHVLLRSMASVIEQAADLTVVTQLLSMPLQRALLAWSRKSELSADRAAAAFMGSTDEMMRVMLRFVGVPSFALSSEYDLDLFAQQAAEAESMLESKWERVLQWTYARNSTHPLVASRVNELRKWEGSESFRRLSQLAVKSKEEPTCETCGHRTLVEWKFCQKCGGRLQFQDR